MSTCVSLRKNIDITKSENEILLFTCLLSQEVYDDSHGHNTTFIECSNTDTQCIIKIVEDIIYIAFRGTSSSKDVLTDLKIYQVPIFDDNHKIKVHFGFNQQYRSVHDYISHFLFTNCNNKKKIVCCGHSLGAGLATICSAHLSTMYSIPVECYTFGSPRVGNNAFKEFCNKHIAVMKRIALHSDPVTYVPINPLYTHVTPAICYDTGKILPFKKFPVNRFCRFFNMCKNIDISCDSHRLNSYISAISFHINSI